MTAQDNELMDLAAFYSMIGVIARPFKGRSGDSYSAGAFSVDDGPNRAEIFLTCVTGTAVGALVAVNAVNAAALDDGLFRAYLVPDTSKALDALVADPVSHGFAFRGPRDLADWRQGSSN